MCENVHILLHSAKSSAQDRCIFYSENTSTAANAELVKSQRA